MKVTLNDIPRIGKVKVLVNDIDITNRCFEADDIEGYALCYKYDENGKFYLDLSGNDLVIEKLEGKVNIVIFNTFDRVGGY